MEGGGIRLFNRYGCLLLRQVSFLPHEDLLSDKNSCCDFREGENFREFQDELALEIY